eukprot:TRINITY_DN1746_c0_g4_i1.p1 TRINITY_DN1746_c0_g4~~TRINITY_DN1746_c0_g4_i1.p1  ORF type:complete len:407 (-),score=66.37 TRINITY_DN1746_c0_g4_i1:45-1232(-)
MSEKKSPDFLRSDYHTIVIGCGGIGSASLYWLSKTTKEPVLGIEQFKLGHDAGGSQDHSRIIRLAYSDPAYTALTPYTYAAWTAVEKECDIQLVYKCGSIVLGEKDDPYVADYAEAMRSSGIPFDDLSGNEAMKRWPQFTLKETDRVVYQPEGGLVDPKKGNAAHILLSMSRGAHVLKETKVNKVEPIGTSGAKVYTDKGVFTCKKLIITAGAWTNQILSDFGIQIPLNVHKEQVTYYSTPNLKDFSVNNFPVFIAYTKEHGFYSFYGFPIYGEMATKVGWHKSGKIVDPDTRTYETDVEIRDKTAAWLKENIPGFLGPELYTKTCLYTCTPDDHFILDTLPNYPQVSLFVGAGHAYKFASLFGLILSQIALTGKTNYPIQRFSLKRPGLIQSKI